MNPFKRIKDGLYKSSLYLTTNIIDSLKFNQISNEVLEEIESVLLSADLGVDVTNQLIGKLKKIPSNQINDHNSILKIIASELSDILKEAEKSFFDRNNSMSKIVLFLGVNGSGKTTSIGKLIFKLKSEGKILVVACDTFRAAAIDQLKAWSKKNNIDFFEGSANQDPASVAYQACEKARNENYDYVFIDTAGRLSNNTNLVNQLVKIKNVIKKTTDNFHYTNILVLDGTNGSNMISQVETFKKTVGIDGLIVTKLDGTAKGGAIISIAKKYQIPIYFIGLGERDDDLHEFDSKTFAHSLLNLDIAT